MSLEDEVFKHKRFVIEKLEQIGFEKCGDGYRLVRDFMDGDFRAVLVVDKKGMLTGRVIDVMNDEEYSQLRIESLNGAYVNSVRAAYKELLGSIAESCCKDVLFASDQANRLTEHIMAEYGVNPDFPWGQGRYQNYGTFRHADSGKWFALIMNVKWDALLKDGNADTVDVVNLKIDPGQGDTLRETPGIYPGYHMNHRNWISVALNGTLSDDEIARLVRASYDLT